MLNEATAAEVLAREQQRAAALISGDLEALSGLLDDQLIHIHMNGMIDTKPQFLKRIQNREFQFLDLQRGKLTVRDAAGAAIVTGTLRNVLRVNGSEPITAEALATQLFVPESGTWKMIHFHASRLA